jgi:uncharacterized protein (DUF736 family)
MSRRQFDNIGALWEGVTRDGTRYLSGEVAIDGAILKIVIFPNARKRRGSRQPDYTIHADHTKVQAAEDVIHSEADQYLRRLR